MGYFSWLTADTKESVIVDGDRPAYLLQPNGGKPFCAHPYDGAGNFDNKNAYVWVSEANIPEKFLKNMTEEEKYLTGVNISLGKYYEDTETGEKISIFSNPHPAITPRPDRNFNQRYDQPLPGYNKSANELIASGRFVERDYECKYPIKISFNPKAVYENLPASEECPNQGYLPEEEDEEN